MDRRHFTTGLAAGALSYFSGDNFGHAIPYSRPSNDQDLDEDALEFLRRLDLGALGELTESLPRLRRNGASGSGRGLSLIETPPFLPGTTIPMPGLSFIIDLDRDLVTRDGSGMDDPSPGNADFRFEGNVRLSGDPALLIQRAAAELTVRDGASVVIGGLMHDLPRQGSEQEMQSPNIGELPVIGHLFRQAGTTAPRRNLMIFVTARIVTPEE